MRTPLAALEDEASVRQAGSDPCDHVLIVRPQPADHVGQSCGHLVVHPDIGSALLVAPPPLGSRNGNACKIASPRRHGVSATLEQTRIIIGAGRGKAIFPEKCVLVRNKHERLRDDGAIDRNISVAQRRKRQNVG